MENFTFWSPTEFVFGKNTESKTGQLAKAYGAKKVLLVYGSTSAIRSGLISRIETSLKNAGIDRYTLHGIRPNPTDDRVREGIRICRQQNVDFILAVGGGSVIDTAKAIAIGVPYDGDFWDFFCRKQTPSTALPIGVVLTIPAAGSEGSGNSVITKIQGRHKLSVRYPMLLRPKFAIMNPELTYSLPWFQTACGIVDMLCHIYERYFSPTPDTELVDAYSEAIMRSVMADAIRLKNDGNDYNARASVMWAGTIAHNGLCGVGKTEDWASHRLEHEISAFYEVAHGAGLAVIVPAWMKFVSRKNPHKLTRFAINVMDIDPIDHNGNQKTQEIIIRQGIQALENFYHTIGLTTSLRQLIDKDPDIDMLVASLNANMGSTLGEYVPLTMDDCKEIYRLAL